MIWLALAWRVTFCSARSPERRSGNGSSNDSVARVPPCMTPPGGTDTESSPRNCKCSSTHRGRGRAPTRWSGCVEAGARSGDVQRSVGRHGQEAFDGALLPLGQGLMELSHVVEERGLGDGLPTCRTSPSMSRF